MDKVAILKSWLADGRQHSDSIRYIQESDKDVSCEVTLDGIKLNTQGTTRLTAAMRMRQLLDKFIFDEQTSPTSFVSHGIQNGKQLE